MTCTLESRKSVLAESNTMSLSTLSSKQRESIIQRPTFTLRILGFLTVGDPELLFPCKLIVSARRILDRYRPEISCFNDDVQGTGCVTLAAIMAGLHVSKIKFEEIRVVIFGSGTAGTGIADQVRDAIATDKGISKKEAAKQIW
jgi:hypothetical protein